MDGQDEVDLARRFDEFVLAGVERVKHRGYNPTMFLRLIKEHGGTVNAAKVLLASTRKTSYGFERLWELGELETSVEFAVCLPWFRPLFTLGEQDEAGQRLRLHDFPLDQRLKAAEQNPPSWALP